ncbi:MAG: ABC transporter ATP-binding protein [Bacteroidales bacterium]|nr:ABC transporter ATP-binding protein [Bacteroidales bacterium]
MEKVIGNNMLNINNISFAYSKENVLEDINLNISFGEFVAVAGPNGSGKSTLIKCINNLLKPQKGNIELSGKKIGNLSKNEIASIIGYVPQYEGRTVPTSVFNTVLLGRKPHFSWAPAKKDFEIVEKVLNQLDLQDFSIRDINTLSGGQRQRVYIARALAQESKILLLDEPTANLDLKHQLEVMKLLKEISNEGFTVIIAIHDLQMAMQFCNRFVLLKSGNVYADGHHEVFTNEIIEKLFEVKVNIQTIDNQKIIIPIYKNDI